MENATEIATTQPGKLRYLLTLHRNSWLPRSETEQTPRRGGHSDTAIRGDKVQNCSNCTATASQSVLHRHLKSQNRRALEGVSTYILGIFRGESCRASVQCLFTVCSATYQYHSHPTCHRQRNCQLSVRLVLVSRFNVSGCPFVGSSRFSTRFVPVSQTPTLWGRNIAR